MQKQLHCEFWRLKRERGSKQRRRTSNQIVTTTQCFTSACNHLVGVFVFDFLLFVALASCQLPALSRSVCVYAASLCSLLPRLSLDETFLGVKIKSGGLLARSAPPGWASIHSSSDVLTPGLWSELRFWFVLVCFGLSAEILSLTCGAGRALKGH